MRRTREAPVRLAPAPAAPPRVPEAVPAPLPATAAEVLRLQRLVGNRAVQRMLAAGGVIQRWPSWSRAKNHIMQGDFNTSAIPTGYHSEARPSSTHSTYGTRTNLLKGTYQKSVKGTKPTKTEKKKPKQSTFFPDKVGSRTATEADVKTAFESAESRTDKKVQTPTEWKDIPLKSIGDTVFPDTGTDRDAE